MVVSLAVFVQVVSSLVALSLYEFTNEKQVTITVTYATDPSLHAPNAYLSLMNSVEERKNCNLHMRYCGC